MDTFKKIILNHSAERNFKIYPEPVRDWSFGLLSGHRLRVLAYIGLGIIILYGVQSWLWPNSRSPRTVVEYIWSWGSLLWLGAVVPGSFGLAGMLKFRWRISLGLNTFLWTLAPFASL